jgi:cytoskeletal protein RodZ
VSRVTEERQTEDEFRIADWHDHQGVVWAAGVAAVVLLGLLVWGVLRVSDQSSRPEVATTLPPTTSQATTSTTLKTLSPTTSYAPPRPQTSEPVAPLPGPPSSEDAPGGDWTPPNPSTTIYNPYAPTTTQGSAGHI